jgi:hypothetical protein
LEVVFVSFRKSGKINLWEGPISDWFLK